MAASLLISCGLQETQQPKHIHISEESNIDGSFMISSILGQRVRVPNSKTVLVCLHQSFKHYLNAGLRLGYNLEMYEGKSVTVIDIVNDIGVQPITNRFLQSNRTEILQEVVCNQFEKFHGNGTVIIDNLEGLLNLGSSKQELYIFYIKLKNYLEKSSLESFTIITKLNNCNMFQMIDANFEALCDLHLRIIKLKSGYFKEVDGKITISKS